jgi:hypothetical protein
MGRLLGYREYEVRMGVVEKFGFDVTVKNLKYRGTPKNYQRFLASSSKNSVLSWKLP